MSRAGDDAGRGRGGKPSAKELTAKQQRLLYCTLQRPPCAPPLSALEIEADLALINNRKRRRGNTRNGANASAYDSLPECTRVCSALLLELRHGEGAALVNGPASEAGWPEDALKEYYEGECKVRRQTPPAPARTHVTRSRARTRSPRGHRAPRRPGTGMRPPSRRPFFLAFFFFTRDTPTPDGQRRRRVSSAGCEEGGAGGGGEAEPPRQGDRGERRGPDVLPSSLGAGREEREEQCPRARARRSLTVEASPGQDFA